MGKDLKGKELGEGLSQRKDGRYSARFKSKTGKRIEKYFKTKKDAKEWLIRAKLNDSKIVNSINYEMTLTEWYNYYLGSVKAKQIRPNTLKTYKNRYEINIEPVLGDMKIYEIKQVHIQKLLNGMVEEYSGSTMHLTKTLLKLLFREAVENDLISKNPMAERITIQKKKNKNERVLSVSEQKDFVTRTKELAYHDQFVLALNTGLRCGELVGLEFSDVDFDNRILHVSKQIVINYPNAEYEFVPPKSNSSIRSIPLTSAALEIFRKRLAEKDKRKCADERFNDVVFLSQNGLPILPVMYNRSIRNYCKKHGVELFSMHVLRHTFATRCIENGMKPKTLQKILGHSDITMTMDRYVHVSEELKAEEIMMCENALAMA